MNISTEIIENITTRLQVSDSVTAWVLILGVVFYLFNRFFNFWLNRRTIQEEKQFELIKEIINEEQYLEKVKSQPYLIRHAIFRRFYLVRTFSVDEVDYLLTQTRLDFSVFDLEDLKSANIMKFSTEENCYIFIEGKINLFWRDKFNLSSFLSIVFLVFLVVIDSIIYLYSQPLFVAVLLLLLILEFLIIRKHSAMKIYLNSAT